MLDAKLDTLLTVAETLNFTQSAARLGITQPAVSQHIRQLESELDTKLFLRENKSLRLTDEGEIAVKYARRLRQLHQNMCRDIRDAKRCVRHLAVGVTPTAAGNIISQVLAAYCRDNNEVHITVVTDSVRNLYQKLQSYELNLAIIEGNIVDERYRSILLDTDTLVLAVAADHPLAHESVVTLDQIKAEKLILRLPGSGSRTLFESTLVSKLESLDAFNVVLEVDNTATIRDLVRNKFGVSVISRNACSSDIKKGLIKALPIENVSMIREINLVYHIDFEHVEVLRELARLYHDTIGR